MSRFYNLDEEKRRNPLARLNLPQGYDVTNIRSDMVAREQPDPMVGRLSAAGVNNPYGNDPVVGSEALMGLGDTSKAYQLAATRGDKRISDTKRRVSELVKLDPTNPLALLVTMLGAREEALTTEELNKLRGIDKKSTRSKLKREKFIKDLKLAGNEKYFEAVVQDKFNGDVDAAINDPKIREKIVAQRSKPEKLKGQALADFANSYQRLRETFGNVKKGLSDGDAKLMGHVLQRMESYLIAQLSDGASEDNIDFMNQAYSKLVHEKYKQDAELKGLLALPSPTKEQQKRIKQLSPSSQPTKKEAGGGLETVEKNLLEGSPGFDPQSEVTTPPEFINKLAREGRLGEAVGNVAKKINAELFGGEKGSLPKGWTREVERINPLPPSPETGLFPVGSERQDIFYYKANNSYVVTKPNGTFSAGILGNDPVKGGFKTPGEAMAFAMTLKADEVAVEKEEPLTPVQVEEAVAERKRMEADMLKQEPWRQEDTTDYKDPFAPKVEGGSVSTYKSPLLVEELGLGADLTGTDATGSFSAIPDGFFKYSGGEHKEEYQEWLNKSEKERIAIVNQLKTNPKLSDLNNMVKTISEAVILKESTGEDATKEKELLDNIIMHLPTGSEKDILSTLRTAEQIPREDIREDVPYSQGYKHGIPVLSAGTGAFDKMQNSLRNLMPEPGMEDFDPMAKPSWLKDTGDTMIVPLDTPVKKSAWKKVVNDFMTITKKSTNVDRRDIGKDKRKADKLQKEIRDAKKKPTEKLDKKSWDTKLGEDIIGGFKSIFGKDMVVPSKGGIQSERDKRAEIEFAKSGVEDSVMKGMGGPSKFDPEGDGYDKETAAELDKLHPLTMPKPKRRGKEDRETVSNKGAFSAWVWHEDEGKWVKHGSSVDQRTGRILKGRKYETYHLEEQASKELGNVISKGKDGYYYSLTPEGKVYGQESWDIESETDESVKFLTKTENESLDPNAIGYKVVPKIVDGKKVKKADGRTTMVYAKDKKGEKIPVSFGLMQITVKTASGTKYGRRLFNKKKANTMDEKIDLLMNPKHNVAIGKEFKNTLKRKIKERLSKIGKKWSEQDIETATIAAYNWNGENFPSVIERTNANNLNQLLQKWDAREDQFVPEETKNHIRRYREMRGW